MKIQKGEIGVGRFVVPYRVYGEAPTAIVCVSGAQQTMAVWKSFVAHFNRSFTVILFDLPGQGRSETLRGPPAVTLDEQITALDRVIAAAGRDERVHLAAASWGTIVVAAYAARRVAMVDRIILGGFGLTASKAMRSAIRDGRRLYERDDVEAVGRLIIERLGQGIPVPYRNRILTQFRAMSRDKCRAFDAHCDFVADTKDIGRIVTLEKIAAKTLIINGANDPILDPADAEVAARRIPDCQLRIIPGVGHFLHFENPDLLGVYEAFLTA